MPPESPDRLSAELIEELLLTPGYQLVTARISEETQRRVRALIDSGTDGDKARGLILGLELALRIPEIIAAESRASKGKHAR